MNTRYGIVKYVHTLTLIHYTLETMTTTTATIKTYLKDIIGLGDNATGTARANAVIDQGMDDLAEISTFY